jgi:hypothetical protein
MWGALAWLGWGPVGAAGPARTLAGAGHLGHVPGQPVVRLPDASLAYGWSPGFLKSTTERLCCVYGVGYAWMLIAMARLTAREAAVRWRVALVRAGPRGA